MGSGQGRHQRHARRMMHTGTVQQAKQTDDSSQALAGAGQGALTWVGPQDRVRDEGGFPGLVQPAPLAGPLQLAHMHAWMSGRWVRHAMQALDNSGRTTWVTQVGIAFSQNALHEHSHGYEKPSLGIIAVPHSLPGCKTVTRHPPSWSLEASWHPQTGRAGAGVPCPGPQLCCPRLQTLRSHV